MIILVQTVDFLLALNCLYTQELVQLATYFVQRVIVERFSCTKWAL